MTALYRARLWRLTFSLALCTILAGCGGTRVVRISSSDAQEEATVIEKGLDVRVTLLNGKILDGEVVEVTADSLTLGKPGNYGLRKTVIPLSGIDKVEFGSPGAAAQVVGGVMKFLGITLVTLIILLVIECHGGCFGDMS